MPDESIFEDDPDARRADDPTSSSAVPEPLEEPAQEHGDHEAGRPGDEPLPAVAAADVPSPEEIIALPITTAAALMEEEEETPPPPEASEPPPAGERHGPFLVQKAPGHGDGFRDLILTEEGVYVPVGIWLENMHPTLTGGEVLKLLKKMGLPHERAEAFATSRRRARRAKIELTANEAVQTLVGMEARHSEIKDAFSRAFVEAQEKKQRQKGGR